MCEIQTSMDSFTLQTFFMFLPRHLRRKESPLCLKIVVIRVHPTELPRKIVFILPNGIVLLEFIYQIVLKKL